MALRKFKIEQSGRGQDIKILVDIFVNEPEVSEASHQRCKKDAEQMRADLETIILEYLQNRI